jgi:hypothetical protein
MPFTDEERTTLLKEMMKIVEETITPGPLMDYVSIEVKAVCKQSDSPYDDAASILFNAGGDVLSIGRKMVALGYSKRDAKG